MNNNTKETTEEAKKKPSEKKKQYLGMLLAIVLVVASFYYATKDIDLAKLWSIIIHADYLWVILSIPVMLLSHWVRAMRWQTMLQPIVKNSHLWNLFSAVMAGYAVNNVSPIPRGGEFVRPYIFARREKVSFTSVFATIIVERFVDVLVLLLMFGAVSFTFRDQIRTALPNLQAEKMLFPVLIFVGVLILSFWPRLVRAVLRVTIKPLSEKIHDKISVLFEKFVVGLSIIHKPSQYFRLTAESLLIWLLYTIPMFMMFFSFGFNQAPYNLGFDDAILLIVISGVAFSISPTPGAIGVFHFLIQNTLVKLYGVSSEAALAYATVNHGIGYLLQVVVGGLFLLRENLKRIPHQEDIEQDLEKI